MANHQFLPTIRKSFLGFATAILLLSCHSSESTKPDSRPFTPAPSDFRLVIGEGGGFAGRWNGYAVDSAGTVFSWSGTMPEQNAKRIMTLARPQFEKLWQTINNAKFFDIDTSGTGNITHSMQVTANGTIHRASWASPSGIRPRLAPVHVLYDSCRAIVSRGK